MRKGAEIEELAAPEKVHRSHPRVLMAGEVLQVRNKISHNPHKPLSDSH